MAGFKRRVRERLERLVETSIGKKYVSWAVVVTPACMTFAFRHPDTGVETFLAWLAYTGYLFHVDFKSKQLIPGHDPTSAITPEAPKAD